MMPRLSPARRLLIGAAVALLAGVAAWLFAIGWRPSPRDFPIQGVDVGEAHGAIDWLHVRADGADFAYVEATRGGAARDARFAGNWAGTAAAGLRRGAVHIWSLCDPGAAQATNFLATVPREAAALPAAVAIAYRDDCPARPGRDALVAAVGAFIEAAEAHLGKPLLIRVSPAIEDDYALTAAIDRTIWVTGNAFPPDYAARPWVMWRASDMRRVDGIPELANWDVVMP